MKLTTIFRIGGFCAATCCALLVGPAAVASAQPSEPNRVAPTNSAKTTANPPSTSKGLKAVIVADAAHRLQTLQGQQVKLQDSAAQVKGAEQAKLAKEREASVAAKTASDAAHLQATVKNQQWLQAMSGIGGATSGVLGLTEATKGAEKADAAALEAQFTAHEAARLVGAQTQINAITANLLDVMATIQQAHIDAASRIARS